MDDIFNNFEELPPMDDAGGNADNDDAVNNDIPDADADDEPAGADDEYYADDYLDDDDYDDDDDDDDYYDDDEEEDEEDDAPLSELIDYIIEVTNGRNKDGSTKAAVSLNYEKWSSQTEQSRTISTAVSADPVVLIRRRDHHTQIDLIFSDPRSRDIKNFWRGFEKYGEDFDKVTPDSVEIPESYLTLVPVSERGAYYIVCSEPLIWTLQPEEPGSKAINVIRLLYENKNVQFFEGDVMDAAEIEAHAQREYEAEQERRRQIEEREEERHAQEVERNQQIEDMRKNGEDS